MLLLLAAVAAAALIAWQFSRPVRSGAANYTVVTDEQVYSSGEPVLITGAGYIAGTSYDVVVTRPDGSIVDGSGTGAAGFDAVAADANGLITDNYLLTTPAPPGEYEVSVYASNDTGHTAPLALTSFYDDTPYPLTITETTVGLTVTVSGTWKWDGCASRANSNKHPGFAIDWGDGTGIANPSPPPATSRDGVYPTDVTSWDGCAPPGTGTWGSVSHTYASGAQPTICVIMYDVSFHTGHTPPTSGDHSTDPWDNGDNSFEDYSDDRQEKCTSPNLATATPTATATRTRTATPTRTNTPTATATATNTPVPTATSTNTATATRTNTPTSTATNTPLPTSTSTNTATATSTNTVTATATNTPLPTATNTPLPTATSTSTATATSTNTVTPTATNTPLPTSTNTPLPTATNTPLPTATNTATATRTNTPTSTATNTPLPTATNTATATATNTPLPTATNTAVATATDTATATNTPLPTATNTPLPTSTSTATATSTNTATATATNTPLPTATNTAVATATDTATATNTALPTSTNTPLPTSTNTPLPTSTSTATATSTNTATATATNTPLPTATNTPFPTATNTPLPTATNTPLPTATNTPLPTETNTPLPTATNTPLPTATNTPLPTSTNSPLPTATNTPLPTATNTPLPTATNTPLPAATSTSVATATNTSVPTATNTAVNTATPAATGTPTMTATPTSMPTVSGTFTGLVKSVDGQVPPPGASTFPVNLWLCTDQAHDLVDNDGDSTVDDEPATCQANGEGALNVAETIFSPVDCDTRNDDDDGDGKPVDGSVADGSTSPYVGTNPRPECPQPTLQDYSLGLVDKNGGELPEGLGAFEFQVKFDHELFHLDIAPSTGWLPAGRLPNCSMTIITENDVRYGCVSTGTALGFAQVTGVLAATLEITPNGDLAQRIRPTKDNGTTASILDEQCEIGDTLGDIFPDTNAGLTPDCTDIDVTVRRLEGDVNGDCQVNLEDQQLIAFRYGAFFGGLAYSQFYDLQPWPTADFDIDIKDLQFVSGRNGSSCTQPIPDNQWPLPAGTTGQP